MVKIYSSEKKKPKHRSSTKYDRILKQITAKEKETSHDKKFDAFEKSLRSQSKGSVDKQKKSSEKKKTRKRRNKSSKESLQEYLSKDNVQENNESSSDNENDKNEESETEISEENDEQIITDLALKKEQELQKKIISELRSTVWKDTEEDKKRKDPSIIISNLNEKKKNIRKPSIPKVKGFHSWLNWNRQGLKPQFFKNNYDLYLQSKLESPFPKEILLPNNQMNTWTFENYDSDKIKLITDSDPIQILCCVCKNKIIGAVIHLWKGYHVDQECFKNF